jgi:hypothetical protein
MVLGREKGGGPRSLRASGSLPSLFLLLGAVVLVMFSQPDHASIEVEARPACTQVCVGGPLGSPSTTAVISSDVQVRRAA